MGILFYQHTIIRPFGISIMTKVWQQVFNLNYKMCPFIIFDVSLNIHICALHVSIMSSEKEKKKTHKYIKIATPTKTPNI